MAITARTVTARMGPPAGATDTLARMAVRVLIIDDDARLFELLESFLTQNDVVASRAADGTQGLDMFQSGGYDAIFLDIMMPGIDGLEVLRRIRQRSAIPIIMLTAKGDETDRVVGLELGADDYLAKPFSPRELLARLKAVLRRVQPELASERLSSGGLVVHVGARRAELAGTELDLTGLEFDLLVALLRRAGRVVPRSSLLEEAGRGDVTVSERTVDVHISHLRKKLGADGSKWIRTVRGVGYVFSKDA